MARRKKEEAGESQNKSSVDFSSHITDLQNKLKLANICNELISAENPFSVKIDDANFLTYLKGELHKILYRKINNEENIIENSNTISISNKTSEALSTNMFSNDEFFILKEIAMRTLMKNSSQPIPVPNNTPIANNNSSIIKNHNNISNKNVYYETGDVLVLTGNTIMIKDDDREVIKAGTEVTLVEQFDNGTILVMNGDTGEEGIIEMSKVRKQI